MLALNFYVLVERFLIDFMIDPPILTNLKNNNYDLICVIINQLTKIIQYKVVKIIINTFRFAKLIINIII